MAHEDVASRIFAMLQMHGHGANGPTIQSTSVTMTTATISKHQLEAVSSSTVQVVRTAGHQAPAPAPSASALLAARLDEIFTDILSRFGLPECVPEDVKTDVSSANGLSDADSTTPTTATSDQGFLGGSDGGELGTPTGDANEPPVVEPAERMFFAVEQAYWFYCDFFHDNDHTLPEFCLSEFATEVFRRCPSLLRSGETPRAVYERFMAYKARIPKCGAVLLTTSMDKVALVQPWIGNVWQFPRGKLGDNESERDAALREVYEETGYDAKDTITHAFLRLQRKASATLYFVVGVPDNYPFQPQTRKEVRQVSWFDIGELMRNCEARTTDAAAKQFLKSFGSVLPYLRPMARWINQERARRGIPLPPITVSSTEDSVSVQESPNRPGRINPPAQQRQQQQQNQVKKQNSPQHQPQKPPPGGSPPKSPSKGGRPQQGGVGATTAAAPTPVASSATAPVRDTTAEQAQRQQMAAAAQLPHAQTVNEQPRFDFAAVFEQQFQQCLSETTFQRPLQRSATASSVSALSSGRGIGNQGAGAGIGATASLGGPQGHLEPRRGMSWGVPSQQVGRAGSTPASPDGSPIPTFGGIPWAEEGASRRPLGQFSFDASSLFKALE